MQSDKETIPLLPIGRRGKAIYIVLSHDPSVSDLRIVMLVEQRADDVVDELVLAVEHVQREGRHEADETDDNELLYELEYEFPELCTVFCENDDIAFNGLMPKIRFERNGTLGQGMNLSLIHI